MTAGQITEITARNSANHEKIYLANGEDIKHRSSGLTFAGTSFQFTRSLSVTYFHGQLADIYKKNYVWLSSLTKLIKKLHIEK